jgi:hypothetical protein
LYINGVRKTAIAGINPYYIWGQVCKSSVSG